MKVIAHDPHVGITAALVLSMSLLVAGCDPEACGSGLAPAVAIIAPVDDLVLQPGSASLKVEGLLVSELAIEQLEVAGIYAEATSSNYSKWSVQLPRSTLSELEAAAEDVIPVAISLSCGTTLDVDLDRRVRVPAVPPSFMMAVIGRASEIGSVDLRLDDPCDRCGTMPRVPRWPIDVVVAAGQEHAGLDVTVSGQGVEIEGSAASVSRTLEAAELPDVPSRTECSEASDGSDDAGMGAWASFSLDGPITGEAVVIRGGVEGERAVASLRVADPPAMESTDRLVSTGSTVEHYVTSVDRVAWCELTRAPAGVQAWLVTASEQLALMPGAPTSTSATVEQCGRGVILRIEASVEAASGSVLVTCADSLGQTTTWALQVAPPSTEG